MDAERLLIIMRGLPSSGKSFRAKQLAEERGVIFSTDDYWYQVNHPEKPDEYSFNPRFLSGAHKWNQLRAQRAIDIGSPLVIIDNTNTIASEFCCSYARYAHWQDYKICIEEPTSEWWLEIRELLKNKRANKKALKEWAVKLAEKSEKTHKVPFFAIERMMWRWESDLDPVAVVESCIESHPIGDES
jgi:hypothetical protein